MLKVSLKEDSGVIVLEPSAKVSKANITKAATAIEPWLVKGLGSLLLLSEAYEDWDALAEVIPSIMNVAYKDQIDSIAVVTDKPTGTLGDSLKSCYNNAGVNIYCFNELEAALLWLALEQENLPA